MQDRIAQIIKSFDEQGHHRTGTDADALSAKWLCAEIKAMGLEPQLSFFSLDRVDVIDASITVDNTRIAATPVFDCNYTGDLALEGTFCLLNEEGDFGVIHAPPQEESSAQQQVLKARQDNRHKGIVVITDPGFPSGAPALVNAEAFSAPFGPPVLQVAGENTAILQDAITSKTIGKFSAHAERHRRPAMNVMTTIEGKKPEKSPVVVMTPRSAWWQCAAERGGGIATLLEIMRHFSSEQPDRSMLFTLNSGHELGHLGLDHFIEHNSGLVNEAHCWIHLGANYAAKDGDLLLQYSDDVIASLVESKSNEIGLTPPAVRGPGQRPAGEARNIFDGGGRYFSILGSNPLFHHPADRYPDSIDLSKTVACTELILNVTRELVTA